MMEYTFSERNGAGRSVKPYCVNVIMEGFGEASITLFYYKRSVAFSVGS